MTRSSRSKPRQPVRVSPFSIAFDAIGTAWTVDSGQQYDDAASQRLEAAVLARIETFDRAYSRFRADSLVTAMASSAGDYQLPPDAPRLMAMYRQLYDLTDGAMTPLIGQVLSDAGYNADYSLRPGTLQQPPSWDEVLEYDGACGLRLMQPALLDFGAAGKGYLADLIGEVLAGQGVTEYFVDAGGDIVRRGTGVLRVGLEHPDHTGQVIGVAELGVGSLCGSAGNRRVWAQYHHIIDPQLLSSPRHIRALWVYAADGLTADALATALFFAPPERLKAAFDFEYAIISPDMKLVHSPGFPADFFTAGAQADA